jgi:CheY-like chemotaxis protein
MLVAEDGEVGCKKAAAEMPDLILMDLDLPIVDGWQATRRLKADQKTRKIPIIALTAHAMSGSREKALAAGCDEFDTKPIDFDRLVQKINLVLGDK